MRLQKFIAGCGYCSRRKAEEMGLSLEEYERTAFEYSSDKHFNE